MSLFKCKMCGGALEIEENQTVVMCEYCGTKQTLPKLDDEKRANMYDRANHFRRNNEFDKAMGIYEQILNEDNTDAEAYWSIVLCRYGIEYVEDPVSHKRLPTVNRAQFTSIYDDEDYKSALQYADMQQRCIYEEEAKTINGIQKGILAISQKEEPFDVFICYKETDNNGRRTPDSVLAQDLYYQLKQEGFKVFFSRITLEDKLGSAYEPYIFAALNSAKVMVVLGTRREHFNAVWVKNEWSRYLALIKNGANKTLIPAYRDMDPYDLPDEFSHLQAQDMSKLGFMQDLIRGIKKIAKVEKPAATVVKETVVSTSNTNIAPLLKRAFISLEDGEWDKADNFCEQVLNQDPENAQAYLGKLMAEFHVKKQDNLKDCVFNIDNNHYKNAYSFADDSLKKTLDGYIKNIEIRKLEKKAKQKAKKKKIVRIGITILASLIIVVLLGYFAIYPAISYANGDYDVYIDMYNIKEFEIPNGIQKIKGYAFAWCDSLTSIVIPNSVTSIGEGAFLYCTSLESVSIPDSVTSIGEGAFRGCSSLESVSIPDSVTSIGDEAFSYCGSLTSIAVDKTNKYYKSMDGNLYGKDGKTLIQYAIGKKAMSFTIPNSVTSIGDYAFADSTLTSIKIGDSVTSIGEYAFGWSTSLRQIVIPDSVTSIGSSAFEYCSSLTIYCEATSKPSSGWHYRWNSYRPVVWGYKGN